MNQIVTVEEPRGVIASMADRFGMRADAFERTVRATCSPAPRRGEEAVPLTREEFAAFMMVAHHYDLNPLTREIYAYPKRGGGVVPIVSIDGWLSLINRQPMLDGYDFEANIDERGNLVSYTCSMYRKDRTRPVVVSEYLSECVRDTEPWKMKHRMLRHKTLIQTARYAFGFGGIYDEDEAERIGVAATRPMKTIAAPAPDAGKETAPADKTASPAATAPTGPRLPPNPNKPASAAPKAQEALKPQPFNLAFFEAAYTAAKTDAEREAIYQRHVDDANPPLSEQELDLCDEIVRACAGTETWEDINEQAS